MVEVFQEKLESIFGEFNCNKETELVSKHIIVKVILRATYMYIVECIKKLTTNYGLSNIGTQTATITLTLTLSQAHYTSNGRNWGKIVRLYLALLVENC